MNDQIEFWRDRYSDEYLANNDQFDAVKGEEGWSQMLRKAGPLARILECGCNRGRNLDFLSRVKPESKLSAIELNPDALAIAKSNHDLEHEFCGPITDANLPLEHFDLVFTCGVLIHIHPDDLKANMEKMVSHSKRYILIAEYFNRTPVMIEYHGEMDKLFKRDFGSFFLENFEAEVVDYGFLWGREYDDAGFDDITWWLFELKK